MATSFSPVLAVVADPRIPAAVDGILQNMERTATLTATWSQAITATIEAHSCIVVDLDDVADKLAGVAVLRRTWGDDVPLIVLSHRPDVAERQVNVAAGSVQGSGLSTVADKSTERADD